MSLEDFEKMLKQEKEDAKWARKFWYFLIAAIGIISFIGYIVKYV